VEGCGPEVRRGWYGACTRSSFYAARAAQAEAGAQDDALPAFASHNKPDPLSNSSNEIFIFNAPLMLGNQDQTDSKTVFTASSNPNIALVVETEQYQAQNLEFSLRFVTGLRCNNLLAIKNSICKQTSPKIQEVAQQTIQAGGPRPCNLSQGN